MNVAFLHGGGQGSWVWDPTIAAMNARCLALDVPGCGTKRARAGESIDNAGIARELIADIEQAGMDDVVLVGHSQAGQVLPLMAALRPDLFRRLFYVTCSIPLPGQTLLQMMGNAPHGTHENEVGFPFDPAREPIQNRFATMFCNDMDGEQASAFLGRLGQDTWPMPTYAYRDWRPEEIGLVPSTYVVCLRDAILPVPWQERFAWRFKAEHMLTIDAGHQVMVTQPDVLAARILDNVG